MKFRKRNDLTVNGVRQGFKERDAYQLRKWNNPLSNPPLQIWSYEEFESQEPEQREYFCAICKGPLSYQRKLEVWKCDECLSFYDTKIQDVPVKNTNQFKATPWFELQHYPTYDLDDIEAPFAEGIDHNTMIEESLETRTQEDKRIQTINLHNVTFADAILAGTLSSKKQAQQQEDG